MYPSPEPPLYFWLAVVPLYGTPLFVALWAVRTFGIAGEWGKAKKGLAAGNARAFALTLIYTALAAIIVFRLHRYGKPSR